MLPRGNIRSQSGKSGEKRGAVPKESNLDKAVREQVQSLPKAQAEMVKSDVKTWKWNRDRIHDIQGMLDRGATTEDERKDPKWRSDLINERHKLITESTSLYSHINRALKGAVASEDELDAFLARK